MTPAISATGLGKRYRLTERGAVTDTLSAALSTAIGRLRKARLGKTTESRPSTFWALRDVSFNLARGSATGIIGRNGSGKSTLLKVLSRVTPPTEGEARVAGRVGSLLEIGTGFHGDLTGRENIFLSGTILGLRREEIRAAFSDIVDFSGVAPFIDTPVKHYSSGMYLRLAFAVAAHLRAEILLIDEVLAVGDAPFQRRCVDKMGELVRDGRTVLFVSHNMAAVSTLCDSGLVLENGRVAALGSIAEAVEEYGRLIAAPSDRGMASECEGVSVGPLRIDGRPSAMQGASRMSFSFDMRITKPFWRLSVQLGLVTHEGLSILRDAVDCERFSQLRCPGVYRVDVQFPALWLGPRGYQARVKVVAHPAEGATERYFSEWLDLRFEPGAVGAGVSDSVLAAGGDWSVVPLPPEFESGSPLALEEIR